MFETKDYSEQVAKTLMNGVNRTDFNPYKAGKAMATEHRYLQNEAFKMCVAFIEALAENRYDARNEYAHKLSKELVPVIKNFVLLCDD